MAFREVYRKQVALLMRIPPLIAEETCFALKGGTAINLFIRDMPRLSVDIDLTYVPVAARVKSLAAIDAAMKRIAARVRKTMPEAHVVMAGSEGAITRLIVREGSVQTKIEVTPVLRGCVYEPQTRSVSATVESNSASLKFRSYRSPISTPARSWQRSIVSIRGICSMCGTCLPDEIDDALRKAFIVYLISHNRPMFEVLAPTRKDISDEFLRGFEGMTPQPVSRDDLIAARETLSPTSSARCRIPIDDFFYPLSAVSRIGRCLESLPVPNCPPSNFDSKISTSSRPPDALNWWRPSKRFSPNKGLPTRSSILLARLGRLAGDDVGFHPLDVGRSQAADGETADQRLDVRFDPALIHGQGGCLDVALCVRKV